MKRLAQQLTEDNLIIKNYAIMPSSEKFATHKLFHLTEEFCKELTDEIERPYYFPSSLHKAYKCGHSGIPHNTATRSVTQEIWQHFGDVKYLKIIKFREDEEANSIPENYVETI